MKNWIAKAALLAAPLMLQNCSLEPNCEFRDLYTEFENYTLVDGLKTTDIVLMGPEFDANIQYYEPYIISSDSAYDALTDFSQDQGCNYCNYPSVDFDKYVLVGFTTEISCQAVNYVKISETADGLQYSLKTVDQTQCNELLCNNFSFNWVLVPVDAVTGEITFETGVARNFCDC